MRAYRISIVAVFLFAVAYPLIAGVVLVFGRDRGVDEIYPIAPWALFCFVPNEEVNFAIRILAVDKRVLKQPQYLEDMHTFSEDQMTVGYSIVQEIGRRAVAEQSEALAWELQLFERSFLRPLGQIVQYELVRRQFDVLERWRTGEYDRVETIDQYVSQSNSVSQ